MKLEELTKLENLISTFAQLNDEGQDTLAGVAYSLAIVFPANAVRRVPTEDVGKE